MPNLYRHESSYPKPNAQRNLEGRTHYVDEGTLRYFRSRILSSQVLADGLLFAIIESCSADPDHRSRLFRGVLFDVFGQVVYRPDQENSFKSRNAAARALAEYLKTIDAQAITRAALRRVKESAIREFDEFAVKLDQLQKAA